MKSTNIRQKEKATIDKKHGEVKKKNQQGSPKYSFCDYCGHYKHFVECIKGMQYGHISRLLTSMKKEIFHMGLVGILCNKSFAVLGSFFSPFLFCFIYLLLHDKILSQWEFSSIHELNESLG